MIEFKCPHCNHPHEEDFSDNFTSPFWCKGCGIKIRLQIEGGTMHCDNCDACHECDNCIDDVRVRQWCYKQEMHSWKPTLAIDVEKCENCHDIRKIPIPKDENTI